MKSTSPATSKYFIGIGASADGSQLREDTFNNTSYIVVPIVSAVGDQVWWPINSPAPVLILSSVLATHAATRNYRPVVMNHPKISGDYVSANSPQVLQDYCFGFMFNSVFDDGRIKVEAWLDPVRAKEVGPSAENVITRLRAGENVEVSEGNHVLAVSEEGVFNGKKYGARWVSAVSDHLAMLDAGDVGACDNKMGCGRLDTSASANENNNGLSITELINDSKPPATSSISAASVSEGANKMKESIFSRMVAKIRSAMSNNDLRWKLFKAVSELEPGVQYIDDEDVNAKTFRYVVMICFGYSWEDSSEREYHTYQRTFSVDSDNNVTVNDDRVELVYDETKAWVVKPVTADTPVETETEMAPMSASTINSPDKPCECQNKNKGESIMKPTVTTAQKNLASQLIASSVAPFEENDRAVLEAMTEEKLGALVKGFEEPKQETPPVVSATASTPAPVVAAADPNSVTLTRDEYASIKAAADAHSAQIAARKAHLITSLKTAQSEFTEADLTASDLNTLEKLARAFKVDAPTIADYSLRGVPESGVTASATDKIKAHKPTDTWAAARANRAKINHTGTN